MTQANRRLIITLLVVFAAIGVVVLLLWAQREQRQERETSQKQDTPQTEETPQEQEPSQEQETRQKQDPVQIQQRPQAPPPPQEESPQEPPHSRVVIDVSAFRAQLNDYRDRNGAYPTTAQGLRVLGVVPPKDPWGNDYIYNSPSIRQRESYDLLSAGPDGRADTPDDDWGEEGQEASPTEQ
jgi:hypothetical protein